MTQKKFNNGGPGRYESSGFNPDVTVNFIPGSKQKSAGCLPEIILIIVMLGFLLWAYHAGMLF
jgi:hypothetical protein